MKRKYQYNFSMTEAGQYDSIGRLRKAQTMISVLSDYSKDNLRNLTLLDIGGSGGIIDDYLADFFLSVTSIDIDINAIEKAKNKFYKKNLTFEVGDALNLNFSKETFDVVICSQVYEHVPSSQKMMDEIHRVLKKGGICYFAASNRLMLNEPHYNLPLLSVLPRVFAHKYIKIAKKSDYYHELHYTYWGLKKLVKKFNIHDYTRYIISDPEKFKTEYMLMPGTQKYKLAQLISKYLYVIIPGYIWILEKN
jgi:2-polyprenyl-3-methyl-5-hydroxy-6-metoxy-1,4-benzoquinol methylase